MSDSTTPMTSSGSVYATGAFWERLWATSGIHFIVFFVIAYFFYGYQPPIGAPADALTAFYDGSRNRILIATVLAGMAVLNLLWFVAALRSTLADAGQDGWGAAVTAASAAVAVLFLLQIAVGAVLAHSIARSGNDALTAALNDFSWATSVSSAFPRAMLIMAGTFGFWRAGFISNALFGAGVGAVVLVLLGGTTWMTDGFWAPDGAYSRFVSPIVGVVWIVFVTRILVTRRPATRAAW